MEVPEEWKPKIYPKQEFTNLRKYIYMPSPFLKARNQGNLHSMEADMKDLSSIQKEIEGRTDIVQHML